VRAEHDVLRLAGKAAKADIVAAKQAYQAASDDSERIVALKDGILALEDVVKALFKDAMTED